jgi:hypothetical protein
VQCDAVQMKLEGARGGGGKKGGVRLEIRQLGAAGPQILCRRAEAAKDAEELINLCGTRGCAGRGERPLSAGWSDARVA